MSLGTAWDKLPQKWRDAVGRFVKVVAAAATLAVGTYVVKAITGGGGIDPAALWTAVGVAVVSAVEKYFEAGPAVSAKVKAKTRKK